MIGDYGESKTPYRVQARDMEHFAEMVQRRDVTIAKALAESILDAADGVVHTKGLLKPHGLTIEFEDGDYAVLDFEEGQEDNIRGSLEDSLPEFEKREWYELCARVQRFLSSPPLSKKRSKKRAGTGQPKAFRDKK